MEDLEEKVSEQGNQRTAPLKGGARRTGEVPVRGFHGEDANLNPQELNALADLFVLLDAWNQEGGLNGS